MSQIPFRNKEKVMIIETSSPLDGSWGYVRGIVSKELVTIYIVEMEDAIPGYDFDMVALPESCLTRL